MERFFLMKIRVSIISNNRHMLKEESLAKKFIQKGFWLYLFTFLIAPIGYIIRVILTGDMSTEEVGILYACISFLSLLGTYSDFWLTESLQYFIPKYIVKNEYGKVKSLLFITFCVQLLTSSIVGILLYTGADWLGTHYFHHERVVPVLQILSLFFIGIHLTQIQTTLFSAIQDTKSMKWVEFLRMFSTSIIISILWFTDQGNLLSYTWAWITWVFIAVISGAFLSISLLKKEEFRTPIVYQKQDIKSFILYSLGTLFTANVGVVLHQVDMQFITYFLGVTEAGIYSTYQALIGIPFLFLSPMIGFLFPVISELAGRKDTEKIRQIQWLFARYSAIIMIWVGVVYLLTGEYIAKFFFGNNFIPSGVALYFIAPFLVFNVWVQIAFSILAGTGNIRKRITIMLKTVAVNATLTLGFIFSYIHQILPFPNGSSAASCGVGISWIVMWYLSRQALWEYRGKFPVSDVFKNLFMWLGVLFFGYMVWEYVGHDSLMGPRLDAFFMICIAFFVCLIIFLAINFRSLRDFIRLIKNMKHTS